MSERIAILGIGNLLMSDDGIGVHAAQTLATNSPAGVDVVDAGTDFLSALPFLESADRALIIDAVQAGGTPGTIYRLTEEEINARHTVAPAHATNLLAARGLLPPGAKWPEILILGIEPAELDYGLELSPLVAAALPRVVAQAREITAMWRESTGTRSIEFSLI